MALGIIPPRSPIGVYYKSPLGVRAAESGTPIPGWWQLVASSDGSTLYGMGQWGDAYEDYVGIYKSSDAGETWAELTTPSLGTTDHLNAVIACSPDGSVCTISSGRQDTGYVYVSTDGGSSWSGNRRPANTVWTSAVAMNADGTVMYVATAYNGGANQADIWKSADYGQNWASKKTSAGTHYFSYIACSANGQYVIVGTQAIAGQWVSDDSGATWTQVLAAQDGDYTQGVACSPDGQYMMLMKRSAVLNYSANYGVAWSSKDFASSEWEYRNHHSMAISDPDGEAVRRMYFTWCEDDYAVGGYDQWTRVSVDGGTNWTELTPESAYEDLELELHTLATDEDGGDLWVGGETRAMSKSTDSGSTWSATGRVPDEELPD